MLRGFGSLVFINKGGFPTYMPPGRSGMFQKHPPCFKKAGSSSRVTSSSGAPVTHILGPMSPCLLGLESAAHRLSCHCSLPEGT